jgi:hypothetical protein
LQPVVSGSGATAALELAIEITEMINAFIASQRNAGRAD